MQPPEISCMEPENYKKFFRALYWSGTRKIEKSKFKLEKEKLRRLRQSNSGAICNAPKLLGNPSQFAVYAAVRRAVLQRWRHVHHDVMEGSDGSDNDEPPMPPLVLKLPKITGIGLHTVFGLISQARFTDAEFCKHALMGLLDVLQGHAPEELYQEPSEIISDIHAMLIEVATGSGPGGRYETPTALTALSSSCLIALSVARGEVELILNAVASLVMSHPSLSNQSIQIPSNLTSLQRSVQSVILGTPSRNLWLNHGVPHQSLVTSFPVDLPSLLLSGHGELIVRSLVSDGCFLYVFTSKGLLKIGSGYGSSIKQHVYVYKPDFFSSDRHGWLGFCNDKLYVRIGRKKTEIFEVDKHTLEVRNVIRLDPGLPTPIEPKSAVFSDGNQLGLILLTNYDLLTVKMYDIVASQTDSAEETTILNADKEFVVQLLRRRTLVLGRAPFDDAIPRRSMELDTPVAMQLDDSEDDPLTFLGAGQDFGLLTTASGKVYYTGKANSLGYKVASPNCNKWNLMKETLFTKNEGPHARKCKVRQVAVGHEGVHAIIVLDSGVALFTGVARRGEDGDPSKHRRPPKPTRAKKMLKAEGHHILYAACNYGSTALVTRKGALLMFGKDTQHCDASGVVTGLRHERIIQVALGKAHAVALTNFGQVYTFGINNKGQCGREFGYTKEKLFSMRRQNHGNKEETRLCKPTTHTFASEYCRVCVMCRECTGFSSSCQCSEFPNRVPRDKCGCGEGDSGCSVCGVCRRCADSQVAARTDADEDDAGEPMRLDPRLDKEAMKYPETSSEPDAGLKVSSLPPAKIAVPGGIRVISVSAGLHHTVLLTEPGDVLTFGSNQYGQLGAGDVAAHHRIVRVRVPRANYVAVGSNHTAVLTRDSELYTFGAYQKGQLGRPRLDEPVRNDRSPVWYATPGRVGRLGPKQCSKVMWVAASGDQTFVQVSLTLIKTDTLFSATVTANSNSIVILPNRPEHTFKCITINKSDGLCNAWTGPEQVDFVNSLACLDPLYDVLWCYQPQMRVMKCYNILAFDSHKLQRCCAGDLDGGLYSTENEFEYPNYGSLKRIEDFKNLENVEAICYAEERQIDSVALTNMSILNQELAIPSAHGCSVTRMHAAMHLLGCLDSLQFAHDTKLCLVECKRDRAASPVAPTKEDFLTVNRFDSHGGGWGYSGHSVEAIRFMCDTDVLIGGYGLFGGRGDYTAKIRLYDIGVDGGDHEGDGELIAESDDVVFECAPRDRFPVLFDAPHAVIANRWYVAWACINGPSSDCGSSGQTMVVNEEVSFQFKTSKKSNNGTDVNAGQIPCLLYNTVSPDQTVPIRNFDVGDPVVALSRNISRKVTVACFRSLITLLQWSWNALKNTILDTNGQMPINYQKLTLMKHQKRLVYVIRACLRLVKSYINEVYPVCNRKRNSNEYMSYFESIADVRNLIQTILADATPSCAMLPKKPGKNKAHRVCYVQFALEMTNSILKECHDTIMVCYHAFFPTPSLKWNHLCSLLFYVKDGVVPPSQARELTSICAALCTPFIADVLHYVTAMIQRSIYVKEKEEKAIRPESKVLKSEVPTKSATVPRSSHASQKPPPVPPRAGSRDSQHRGSDAADPKQSNYTEWDLYDILPRMLDIVLVPIKQQMMTRQCGQPHDHGELKQHERLAKHCCKLVASMVAECVYNATPGGNEPDGSAQHLVTPSRFLRVNAARAWNTGSGSPDAVCFTVDRQGVLLLGAAVYSGLGSYEYELELLHDVRQLRSTSDDGNQAHCWVSLEVAHGTFSSADGQNDIVQLKFDRPVPLKEDLRYAIRLCNHGGRTVNGDCGLPSVKGPDGTTFRFASCSLSFNGTSLARGQIPSLIYYGASKHLDMNDSTNRMLLQKRGIALQVADIITERAAELFCTLRNELTAEDLRRNATVLQNSPAINVLLPYTLASLEALKDSKSVVKLLDMMHKVLPHVAAINLLVPNGDDTTTCGPPTTTGHHYTWIESEHPYKHSTVTNMRVLFPPSVAWMVLEMDPRCITAQPEDSLTVYAVAGAPKHRCHCATEAKLQRPLIRKRYVQLSNDAGEMEELCDEGSEESPCLHYNCTYVAVTPKMSNVSSEWPRKAILVPGNEVIFSLETASDYLNEYNKTNSEESRFGFRCLCVGYELPARSTHALAALEMELVHFGAACAARLLASDAHLSPLDHTAIMELQTANGEGADNSQDASEALFLSRGLELSSPPTIHQVLDLQPLLRCVSTERQFLSDFVAGASSTAGGRLARWLAPAPRVEPSRCELRAPGVPARPAAKLTLPVLLRDQYGDVVASPALKVEVVVQRLEDGFTKQNRNSSEGTRAALPDAPYQVTLRDTMRFHAITMMKAFQGHSFEELRFLSGAWGGPGKGSSGIVLGGRLPAARLPVRSMPDGSRVATWTPRAPGTYTLQCTLDDQPALQELTIEVTESVADWPADRVVTADGPAPAPPIKLRRYAGIHSAGLRVRASPSLQAEELGRVPNGANIAFVEEVINKDGTWLRLSAESTRAYADSGEGVAWCLQYHRHLERTLLEPTTTREQAEYVNAWAGYSEAKTDVNCWTNEEDNDHGSNEFNEDRKMQTDSANESDSGVSPFSFGPEPSKRDRLMRDESMAQSPGRRLQRRSNGNGGNDEWWTPEKYRDGDDVHDSNEALELAGVDHQDGRLAQTGTQTSPDSNQEDIAPTTQFYINPAAEEEHTGPRGLSCDRPERRSRAFKRTSPPPPPPVPARSAPPAPRKHALSAAQAECLRAVFAALLWHEGIVHDAIACAAFLKFHPHLPKQGASVITRSSAHELATPRPQRHSLEVSSAGQYLLSQANLENVARSNIDTRSRKLNNDAPPPISEEEGNMPTEPNVVAERSSTSIVNVLPPALRALVALWDGLNDADQLAVATDKFKKIHPPEKNENDLLDIRPFPYLRKKRDWKTSPVTKTPYSVRCELCGGKSVPPPLAAHMRQHHPGCRGASLRGYDRAGAYLRVASPPPGTAHLALPACGHLAQAYHLWYIFCEKCREKALKSVHNCKQPKTKTVSDYVYERVEQPPAVDHIAIKENAIFLLDLVPLTNSESLTLSPWCEPLGRSPPTPPGSVWQPAPPFQCLSALGAAPRAACPAPASDTARYHSLGRPPPVVGGAYPSESLVAASAQWPRVHRSVSMGQAGVRDLACAARPPRFDAARVGNFDPADTLSGGGSSLLAQPSASLQRLVGGGEWSSEGGCAVSAFEPPCLDAAALIHRPTLAFVLAKRDLHQYRQKLDTTVRVNTVRQYALEAMNWLLRSSTQPTCVHDVMWWFCNALEKYAHLGPPLPADDKEGACSERLAPASASSSSLCPGGRSARGARAALHALLGSVGALAPSLPPASAAALQAVRCWALHYTHYDRTFLHRSQVFSVISKILSHAEDGAYEDGMLGALHESFHSYMNKENYVWNCSDVTGWCDVTVSSRQGMAGALTDGSTETFWESGDEDRNKAKWIQVSYPGGTPDDRPHLVCVHVDNTRDTVNKTLLLSFLYSGGSSDLFHMQDIEVDPKSATWLCYTLPRMPCAPLRVRCELRGPEAAVRVRQVRVLGAPAPLPAVAAAASHVLHALTEADTLRVFRLLTSQVFGKLLEWEGSVGSDSGADGVGGGERSGERGEDAAPADDSDLREHVVGILFAGHKLTSLQRQVMSHIVCAIGCEAARARDDWETALLCAEPEIEARDAPATRNPHAQDNYCFEMMSLLLALSGSAVGRVHLAQRTELLADLLALLHTGSERVQRQVISLLRRMVAEIPPQKMLAAINYGNDLNSRVSLLEHLVTYLAKAITVQVKIKGGGGAPPNSAMMGVTVTPSPASPSMWFMRGVTSKKHAHLVAKLLTDMAEGKVSSAWGAETRAALAAFAGRVAQTGEPERRAAACIAAPTMWLALAALCVCEESHLELINTSAEGREGRAGREAASEARQVCANHDDGVTLAVVECRSCGALCAECDRFLHLNRAARTHHRQICKEEESAIRIDIHEGCGRAKLFWLLLLVDRRTLKALAEFRSVDNGGGEGLRGSELRGAPPAAGPPGFAGTCRFCGTVGSSGLLAIGNVCADQQCQEHGAAACARVLPCGHACGGVRGERVCLPCLFGCAAGDVTLRQDADDMCMICFTDPLQAAPAIQLKCGHVFHLHCCKKVLANKWIGPRITFSFSQCPICKDDICHWTLEEYLSPVRRLREEVRRKALMRLEHEGLAPGDRARPGAAPDPATFAMERYAYYVCHKCDKAYFGGLARCEAETSGRWEPAELVCGACSDVAGARSCPKHGADFLEYKCRYCCSVAVFFCFGTSHFCNACHDEFQRVTNIPMHLLPQCPAGPKGEQLPGTADECPLHVNHPPTGEEFALGCGVCRQAHAF